MSEPEASLPEKDGVFWLIYCCTHCGGKTLADGLPESVLNARSDVGLRKAVTRDHTDPFECIEHLRTINDRRHRKGIRARIRSRNAWRDWDREELEQELAPWLAKEKITLDVSELELGDPEPPTNYHGPLDKKRLDRMPEKVAGVYALLTASGYVNYINTSKNLRLRLLRHLREGDIPAVCFRVWEAPKHGRAIRLAQKMIKKYKPYYNG